MDYLNTLSNNATPMGEPEWTEKPPTGRILDPLHIEPVRKRLLTDLLYGIVSIAVTQRIRYFSFYLWCLNNKSNLTDDEIVLLEKIYLLANISHEYRTKQKPDYNGLAGATSKTNDGLTQIKDLYGTVDSFSLDDFQIHKGDSCGFFDYFKGPLVRLLLIDNKKFYPTPLGKKIGEEFGKMVSVPFDSLLAAIKKKTIDKKTIDLLGNSLCYCKLEENTVEQNLLRKSFFYLIQKGEEYDELNFLETDRSEGKLDSYLKHSFEIIEYLEEKLGQEMGDEFLPRFNKGGFDVKMQKSLLLFLWLLQEHTSYLSKKSPGIFPSDLDDIQKMWKIFVYSEYMIFCVESFFYGVLTSLRCNEGIKENDLVERIVSHPLFEKTLKNLISTEKIPTEKLDFIDYSYNRIYFDDEKTDEKQNLNSDRIFSTIEDIRSALSDKSLDEFDIDSYPNEYQLKSFIMKRRVQLQGDSLEKSSEIFAASFLLLFVLEQRYKRYFSLPNFLKFWEWIKVIEDDYFGPHKFMTELIEIPNEKSILEFIYEFVRKEVINRSINTFYKEKVRPGRAPLIISQEIDGSLFLTYERPINDISIQEKSDLKFKRLIDIFYGLGFTDNYKVFSPTITEQGKKILNLMIG